jgi:hypothetical protein
MEPLLQEFGSILVGVALVGNMLLSWITYLHTQETANNIKKLEINTNSIKDALVATTASDSFNKGVIVGKGSKKS